MLHLFIMGPQVWVYAKPMYQFVRISRKIHKAEEGYFSALSQEVVGSL